VLKNDAKKWSKKLLKNWLINWPKLMLKSRL
jgi:hypothetical protein